MHGNIYKLCAGDGMFCDRTIERERQCQGYPPIQQGIKKLRQRWSLGNDNAPGNSTEIGQPTSTNRQNNNNDIALVYLQDGQQQSRVQEAASTPMSGHPTTRSGHPTPLRRLHHHLLFFFFLVLLFFPGKTTLYDYREKNKYLKRVKENNR